MPTKPSQATHELPDPQRPADEAKRQTEVPAAVAGLSQSEAGLTPSSSRSSSTGQSKQSAARRKNVNMQDGV